jgi:protein tyrosine phosphatase (PTP) superfamily phosphohydrolase (DUF442 family)
MEGIRKINDEFAVAGRASVAELHQLAFEGFKSVLMLHLFHETTSIDERRQINQLGLHYEAAWVVAKTIDRETVVIILQQLETLPKPALISCHRATLAAAMVLMHIAMRQGETLQQAFDRADRLKLFE